MLTVQYLKRQLSFSQQIASFKNIIITMTHEKLHTVKILCESEFIFEVFKYKQSICKFDNVVSP